MAFDFDPFVGMPWLERGRTPDGCDCWGLHRLVFEAGTGVELPSYADDYAGAADRIAVDALIAGGRSTWRPIPRSEARTFDLVLLHGRPWHVGTVVRPGYLLHCPEGRSSVIEPFTTGRFGRLVEGIYRHEALS